MISTAFSTSASSFDFASYSAPVSPWLIAVVDPVVKGSSCCSTYDDECTMSHLRQSLRNPLAMRDQKFQARMSNFEQVAVGENPETLTQPTVAHQHASPDLEQELDKQAPFQRYIKQHTPTRKPSPALIQSIKDRIKLMDFHD